MSAPRVTTAAEAAARDRSAIHGGTPSFDLMVQAGSNAAAFVLREFPAALSHGVACYAGTGNNGGDAYIVAAQLARAGVVVRLHASLPPKTPDAQRAAHLAAPYLVHGTPTGDERVVIDGVLGTGHQGELRVGSSADCARMAMARDRGAQLVALDVPSGLDATSGAIARGSVAASVTLCLGTIKRGVLMQRAHAGRIVLLDIGLRQWANLPGEHDDAAWRWADAQTVRDMIPAIAWNAHKGTRGRVGLAGGAEGMAGAIVLAARAAARSGAGLIHAMVHPLSVPAVQSLVPQALAHTWTAAGLRYDALAVGPGLGRDKEASLVMHDWLDAHRGTPLVLDADALWLAADAANDLGTNTASLLKRITRDTARVVCTPHPGEFARLLGEPLPDEWEARAALLSHFATRANCTVLLKGTPTLVATPDAEPLWVVPHGTAMLATGGSGDCLSGIIATLLAQGCTAREAAVAGATVHGRAAERATSPGTVRGLVLDDMLQALRDVWRELDSARGFPPGVLAELPAL
ncbi:NAD(P)H-hydrate dehydratase [Gemmatimonas sp.]|uniref:NAD(P)H-hydrate dehydratase n=1 Tax=Gemmatimonas sp. TaxID=1962908 RepID=UPI00334170F5